MSGDAGWRFQVGQPATAGFSPLQSAFTLLEVLVALSLSVLLIGAIYAGLNLYFRFSATGHDEVERALLARSLLRKIELDVRSVMYSAPVPASSTPASSSSQGSSSGSGGNTSSSGGTSALAGTNSSGTGGSASGNTSSGSSGSSGGSGSSSSSTTTASTTTTAPEDAASTPTAGVYGNSTMLLMNVSKPGNEQTAATLAASGNVQMRISDMATIAYYVSGSSSGAAQQTAGGNGLARMEGDRLALVMADSQSSTALMASCTQIVAHEVTAIQFLYFDGFRWVSSWDSNVYGGLPKAIDIKLFLAPHGRSTTPDLYNLTIAIPLAKPIDTSTITTTQ